jgi:hypothetical protein
MFYCYFIVGISDTMRLSLLFCLSLSATHGALAAPVAKNASQSSPKSAVKKPPVSQPMKVLARDTNGPYTLEVVRAAWATPKDIGSWPRTERALTLWVRVIAKPNAPKPTANLSLANYLIDGRIGRPNSSLSQAIVLDVVPTAHRGNLPFVPLHDPTRVSAGQSVWRAQNASPHWNEVLAEWEFLTPGPSVKAKELPLSILQGTERENSRLRRFAVTLSKKDIEPLPIPKTLLRPLREADLGSSHIEIFTSVVRPKKWTSRSPQGEVTGGGDGYEIRIPIVLKARNPGYSLRWALHRSGGREWRLTPHLTQDEVERPGGGWLGPDERTFELTTTVPKTADLSGDWTLEVWEAANNFTLQSSRLQFALSEGSGKQQKLDDTDKNSWQVLEARYFDTNTPLPERFGTVWSGEGIAVLLRRHETSAQEKSEVFVKSATDENGIDLKPNSSQVEFLRREEVEANSVKTLYSIWSAVLKPSPSATPQLTVIYK